MKDTANQPADVVMISEDKYHALVRALEELAPGRRDEIVHILAEATPGGIWPRSVADDDEAELPAEYHMGAALFTATVVMETLLEHAEIHDVNRREVEAQIEATFGAIPGHVREWIRAKGKGTFQEMREEQVEG
ncbi:hypothetical protein [Pseudoponticoccus marisrubri]|uniref:Uncharacterized protein n=1 Tax=Pseudoponticoccus marisrubri TaxID=1685382 RepID=A0A0W7WP91_9RHOB|nr:hypothetical protein [Pseudoponticoccus marisrubri]KUF12400.1 hypothetical protein AVJ23_01325 [Pseudoponticoccus marisrubri]